MSIVSREEKLAVFKKFNRQGRAISNLASARKTNTAPDYSSPKLLARSKKSSETRTKISYAAMKEAAGIS